MRLFKYLGCFIHQEEPNTGESEINHRIQLATAKFAEMSNLLQNFQINLRTRIKFLNSFVRSRLTYACQSWNPTVFQLERLDSAYRRFLWRMVRNGLKFLDEDGGDYRMLIDNIRLHRLCGTSDVSSFLRQQQQNYMAAVMRMGIDWSTKLLTFNMSHIVFVA